jgi:hypothetical protein
LIDSKGQKRFGAQLAYEDTDQARKTVYFHLGNKFWDQEDISICISMGDKSAKVQQSDIGDTAEG